MSQHLWQYCINRYMLLGAINSVASFSHYTHVPSTFVCIGLTFINGRACTRAFICSAAVSGVRLPVSLTSRYTIAGTRLTPTHVLFYDLSVPRARSRYRARLRASPLFYFGRRANLHPRSYIERDIHKS